MMLYNGQSSPTNVQYSSYRPDQRSKIIWLLALAVVVLGLSVTALIIVFAVEHSWFSDSFSQTNSNRNYYGLWRFCFYANRTCESWFSTDGPYSTFVYDRLNQARVGINAWQALEIVFIFLATSALIFVVISFICYRFRKGIHYYLAILAAFCAWPAACVGIAGLFVFGFSVYNVAPAPRNLDWCFYVNIVAVVLCIIGAILLTVYGILSKRPIKSRATNTGMETFTDLHGYPATYSPSNFVVTRQDKKKRKKPYTYSQEHPSARMMSNAPNTDYITNPNYQMLSPYNPPPAQQGASPYRGSGIFTSQSATSIHQQRRYYQPPTTSYRYQPPHWHRSESNPINYNPESGNDYIQRGIYRPARLNPTEVREEPRVLHYYTGYDHFATIDPSETILTRHHPPISERASPIRYPSYYPQSDYLKSAM